MDTSLVSYELEQVLYLSIPRKGLYCTGYPLLLQGVAQNSDIFFIPGMCLAVEHLLHSAAICPEYTNYLRVDLSVDFLCIKM